MSEETDYEKMKKEAGEFSTWLVKHEFTFKTETNECNPDGIAVYFDVEARDDKIVTFIFKDNGYVGIQLKEEEDE